MQLFEFILKQQSEQSKMQQEVMTRIKRIESAAEDVLHVLAEHEVRQQEMAEVFGSVVDRIHANFEKSIIRAD